MVAAVCTWHQHHAAAREAIERRLAQSQTMVVAGPALIEAYAVLTRLPPPYRLSPDDALALIDTNFVASAQVVVLDAEAYQGLLRRAPREGITGGRVYDAVIAACVLRAPGASLLTFNEKHFASFTRDGLEIVVPR